MSDKVKDGKILTIVVLRNPIMNLTKEELCKKHLANYKIPKEFELRPLLPMLPNGKINRLALVEEEKVAKQEK